MNNGPRKLPLKFLHPPPSSLFSLIFGMTVSGPLLLTKKHIIGKENTTPTPRECSLGNEGNGVCVCACVCMRARARARVRELHKAAAHFVKGVVCWITRFSFGETWGYELLLTVGMRHVTHASRAPQGHQTSALETWLHLSSPAGAEEMTACPMALQQADNHQMRAVGLQGESGGDSPRSPEMLRASLSP